MSICQCLLDIFSGFSLIFYSFGALPYVDTFFWFFACASIWNFTFILGRYRFILSRPDEALRYRHWDLNARIYAAIFMAILGIAACICCLEIEDTSLFYCEYSFGHVSGNIGSAILHILFLLAAPLALTIIWMNKIGKIYSRKKVITDDTNEKAKNQGGVDFDTKVTVDIFIFALLLASGSRWLYILFKPLTYQTIVSHEVLLGLTLVAGGCKAVANPILLWQLHEYCASEGTLLTDPNKTTPKKSAVENEEPKKEDAENEDAGKSAADDGQDDFGDGTQADGDTKLGDGKLGDKKSGAKKSGKKSGGKKSSDKKTKASSLAKKSTAKKSGSKKSEAKKSGDKD
ncbi:uncharacterized protein LOC134854606 [Symsagittifera roscoffensis]|uniref:uncharacterized protein LOC134854606 n=1 Tax=Symsagittifera roscoffensis TaxID=84072 RepID=UPI00307B78EC